MDQAQLLCWLQGKVPQRPSLEQVGMGANAQAKTAWEGLRVLGWKL